MFARKHWLFLAVPACLPALDTPLFLKIGVLLSRGGVFYPGRQVFLFYG